MVKGRHVTLCADGSGRLLPSRALAAERDTKPVKQIRLFGSTSALSRTTAIARNQSGRLQLHVRAMTDARDDVRAR
jgi:hypothetical protein